MADTFTESEFKSAATLMRVHGILSIIFGGLGILIGMFFVLLFAFAITEYNSYQVVNSFIMAFCVLILGVLPHVYLLVSGIHLIKNPVPPVAKTLVIINLVVGILYNLPIMIFAIINLVQLNDYEHGYKRFKTK